jgi:triacylglycerol lipase
MPSPSPKLDRTLAILNGLVGDYLARTQNGLAIPMTLVRDGAPLALDPGALAAAFPQASRRVVVNVHGLMATEGDWAFPDGTTYGSRLAAAHGLTPLDVRYNSGLHVSENGKLLADLLEALVAAWPVPVEELTLLCYSLGGLVARSACHLANERGDRWLGKTKRAYYIGTPHLGAPMERAGNVVAWALRKIDNPYTPLVADVANLRSAAIKDLRFGNLHADDWQGADADALLEDRRNPVPLLPHIRHHLIAGAVSRDPRLMLLFGDAMVPVASATGSGRRVGRGGPLPSNHVRIVPDVTHVGLLHHEDVAAQLLAWHAEP